MASDKELKDYLHRLLVPPGFRPETNEDIEQTLDALSGDSMPDDVVARILAKAKGEVPMSYESKEKDFVFKEETTESEELLALHRGEGDLDSEEIKEMLEQYRKLVNEDESGEDEGGVEESENDDA